MAVSANCKQSLSISQLEQKAQGIMVRKFWIDTDVGSDDAVAIIMALRAPDVEVIGMSAVCGNVPMAQAAINALYVAELCGASHIPVYSGAAKPLYRTYIDAKFFHGEQGFGTRQYPAPKRQPESIHAVPAMIEAIKANPGLVLVTLGPLTNVALALAQAPEIAPLVSRCVVMGGAAATYGNISPAAEYNIWVDPEAARMVFLSGMAVEMVGWEFCYGEFALNDAEIARVRAIGTPISDFALDCNDIAIESYHTQTGDTGLSLPDPVTMAIAIDPTLATDSRLHYADVEVTSELTRGMTVIDRLNVTHDERNVAVWQQAHRAGKIRVTWAVDNARWKALLFQLLS
jgi:purine nucleosidase